jgi:hypothetical protein
MRRQEPVIQQNRGDSRIISPCARLMNDTCMAPLMYYPAAELILAKEPTNG